MVRGADGALGRWINGMGSSRCDKCCEGGDGCDGELHLWYLQSFLLIVCV